MDRSRSKRNQNPEPALAPVNKITLADGKEYELSPLDLNMLVAIEEKFGGKPLETLGNGKLATARFVLYLRLKDKNPSLTEEAVGKLVTWGILTAIFTQLSGGIK